MLNYYDDATFLQVGKVRAQSRACADTFIWVKQMYICIVVVIYNKPSIVTLTFRLDLQATRA